MWFIVVLVLLFVVVAILSSPWRRPVGTHGELRDQRLRDAEVAVEDLEAARDAKYREIRDAELDRQTGKMSAEDFAATDAALRQEAIDILKRLDRAQRLAERLKAAQAEEQVTTGIDLAEEIDGRLPSEPR